MDTPARAAYTTGEWEGGRAGFGRGPRRGVPKGYPGGVNGAPENVREGSIDGAPRNVAECPARRWDHAGPGVQPPPGQQAMPAEWVAAGVESNRGAGGFASTRTSQARTRRSRAGCRASRSAVSRRTGCGRTRDEARPGAPPRVWTIVRRCPRDVGAASPVWFGVCGDHPAFRGPPRRRRPTAKVTRAFVARLDAGAGRLVRDVTRASPSAPRGAGPGLLPVVTGRIIATARPGLARVPPGARLSAEPARKLLDRPPAGR